MKTLDRIRIAWWLYRGRAALKAGKVEKAGEYMEMIEELAPGARPTVEFGKMLNAAALARAKRRVEEDPERAEPRGDYARALLQEGRTDEAAEQVEEGMRLIETDESAKGLREDMCLIAGEVAFEQGRLERALDMFDQGAVPGFTMAGVHYYRGLCHVALGHKAEGLAELSSLVRMAHWVVPMRFREMMEQRRTDDGRRTTDDARQAEDG